MAFHEGAMPAKGFARDRTLMSMDGLESDLEDLYRRRHGALQVMLASVTASVESARDVVQEAFAQALRDQDAFRGEGSLEAWVWRIAFLAPHADELSEERRGCWPSDEYCARARDREQKQATEPAVISERREFSADSYVRAFVADLIMRCNAALLQAGLAERREAEPLRAEWQAERVGRSAVEYAGRHPLKADHQPLRVRGPSHHTL